MEFFNNTGVAFARMSNYELRRAYILFKSLQVKPVFKFVKHLVRGGLKIHFPVGWIVKPTVFKQFIGGTNLNECLPIAASLIKYNVKSILDYSSEDGSSDFSVEQTLKETLHSIEVASVTPHVVFAVFKPTAFCSKEALEILSQGKEINSEIKKKADKFIYCVDTLCRKAYDLAVPIMIDAEDYAFQDFVDKVVTQMMEKYNKHKAIVFNTLQMYRHDRLQFLENNIQEANSKNYFLGIKLVRGAYMERERLRAERLGYPSPIYPNKDETDKAYDRAQEICIQHISKITLFSGTHNEKSNYFLIDLMKKAGISNNDSRVFFSQLYGMSDNITFNLAQKGYNVAKYIPYGPVRKVLPYLIRRAEENSSVAGQTCRELNLICTELRRRKLSGK